MSYLKLLLWCTLIIALYGLTYGIEDSSENTNNEEIISKTINKTLEDVSHNLTNTRTGRVLVYPPRAPGFTLRRRQPVKIRSRADHFPLRTQIRRAYNGVANVQQPQSLRYGYDSLKSSKYIPSSKGANVPFLNNGKGGSSSYRQQLLGNHPNSVQVPALSQQYIHNFKASPTFNGNVVVHPAPNQQQQQQPQQDNSYPKYVKPQQSTVIKPQQSQQQSSQYNDFKQFPIPDLDQMKKYNEQHEKYLQQQKYLTPRDPMAYYQSQQQQQQQQQNYQVQQPQFIAQKPIIPQLQQLQQQQQQPSIPIHEISSDTVNAASNNHIAFPSTTRPQKMYSVYEENDMTELQNNNYQTASYQGLDKEAKEYLRFMNTNEYFLPKKDPNYKIIDEENDRRQFNNLKAQQQQQQQQQQQSQNPLQPYAQSLYQQQQEQQQTAYQQSQTHHHHHSTPYQQSQSQPQQKLFQSQSTQLYSNNRYSDTSAASSYNQPIQVSKLFYDYNQETGKPSSPASSTVVKTSYQTGYNQNQFLVNSQDNKVSKYNGSPTQSTPVETNNVYSQVRQNSQSNRTPEPLRFEFTERDAMIGGVSYTHAPQAQLRYKAVDSHVTPKLPTVESSTTSSSDATLSTSLNSQTYHHNHAAKPVSDLDDDPEDGDDMQEAGTNLYGRQPVVNKNSISKQQTSTTETPPSEQKDTEEYCERICAIVEDEHEEIVCGSDGYMYTSEAQMECYASCLHIDVTIQGKGSCSST